MWNTSRRQCNSTTRENNANEKLRTTNFVVETMNSGSKEKSVKRGEGIFLLLNNRLNLFYLMAFIPLVAIAYFSLVRAVVPFYGFVLLLLKKDKLSSFGEPHLGQKALGVLALGLSLFVYYGVVLVYPQLADPYGIPNYIIHVFGLFLVFFSFSALREAFSSLFLIVAAASSFFVSDFLKPFLAPYLVPFFMHVVEAGLMILRLPADINYYSGTITLRTPRGYVPTVFVWECIGVYSTMLFSIILIVILVEERSSLRTKLLWSGLGLFGTNFVNVIRVITIYLTDYYAGKEAGAEVHYFIGYALFIAWLSIFFFAMSKKPLEQEKTLSGAGKKGIRLNNV